MRPVPVDEQAMLVIVIVRVAADVRPPVANKDALVEPGGEAFRDHAPGKSRADNQVIVHLSARVLRTRHVGCRTRTIVCSMSVRIRVQVPSQDVWLRNASAARQRSAASSSNAASTAATNAGTVSAIRARPCRPYGLTTS